MIPSQREAYCSDAFVVRLLCCGMGGGGISSLAGIFRSLCEFKRALQRPRSVGVRGCNTHARVWESCCIFSSCDLKKTPNRMCLVTRRPSLRLHNYCCAVSKWMEMLSRGKAALVQTDLWRDFQLKFHGVFSCCFRFDRSGLGWIAAAGSSSSLDTGRSLKCFEGSSLGSPEGPWPPWVMLSARSLSLTDVNGGAHAGSSQAHRWGKSRE